MNQNRIKVAEPPKSYRFFRSLIDEKGMSTYRFALTSGVSESCFSLWRHYGFIPKYERMAAIAKTLSDLTGEVVTVDDIYKLDAEK